MIDFSSIISQIYAIPQDSTLYLIEKLPYGTGLFVSNGNVMYLVLNDEHCPSMNIKTDFLNLHTNIFVSAFNSSVQSFENGYYNSVELQMIGSSDIEANLHAFINLCLAHATYMQGQDFMAFFDSLVSLFQLPKEQQYKNLIGFMGELLLIECVHNDYGIDLSQYWHTEGTTSHLDFVCNFANIEVKTTVGDSLAFFIKHDQLFANAEKNYLAAVVIEESNAGRTLEELISSMQNAPDYCNSMLFSFNIEKERRRISPTDLHNKRFALKKMNVYCANEINQFKNIPDYINDLSYKMDLCSFSSVPFSTIISKI